MRVQVKDMMCDTRDRVAREKAAYDGSNVLAESAKLHRRFEHVFKCPNTRYGEAHFNKWIRRTVKAAVVLDCGCRAGWMCPTLVAYGAKRIVGIDISEQSIAEAEKRFGHLAEYHVMDAHRTTFEDNLFDVVLGRAILHHLEYELAIKEIHRILKPGKHALFLEPLGDNPIAKLIRWLTPGWRTPDEMALSQAQIRFADGVFGGSKHLFIGLASVPFGMLSSLVFRNPNNLLMRLSHAFDVIVCRTPLKYYMRYVALVWRKVPR